MLICSCWLRLQAFIHVHLWTSQVKWCIDESLWFGIDLWSLWMYSHDRAATWWTSQHITHRNQVKFSCISLIYQFFIFTTNTLSSFSVWYTLKYFYTQTFVCLWKCLLIFVTLFWTCCTLFVQLLSPCLLANWQDFLCTIFTGEKNQTNLKFYMIALGWKESLGLRCRQGVREGMFKKKGTWK